MKTKSDNDWTVVMTVCVTPPPVSVLIYDIARERIEIPKQYGFLVGEKLKHPGVLFQAVEDAASGTGLIQEGRNRGTPFMVLKPDGDKVRRTVAISTQYENGMVYHRASSQAPWLGDFEHELMLFPVGSHDDCVDCLAYTGIIVQSQQFVRQHANRSFVMWPQVKRLPEPESERTEKSLAERITGRPFGKRTIVQNDQMNRFGI